MAAAEEEARLARLERLRLLVAPQVRGGWGGLWSGGMAERVEGVGA